MTGEILITRWGEHPMIKGMPKDNKVIRSVSIMTGVMWLPAVNSNKLVQHLFGVVPKIICTSYFISIYIIPDQINCEENTPRRNWRY
ncbi:MAG: hypothetical protein ACP5UO_06495, partial [Thermoplasmata archaeon]